MIAQAYYDSNIIRIFDGQSKIADLPLYAYTDKAADQSLRTMHLQKRGKWVVTDFGREAKVRFRR